MHKYRDSSIAPLLDLRRRLNVVMDVLAEIIRGAFSWLVLWSLLLSGIVLLGLVRCILFLQKTCYEYGKGVSAGSMRLSRCFTVGSLSLFTGLWSCVGMRPLGAGGNV